MYQRTKKRNKGFTLIETLVAVSILLLSISAPLTIASKGLASSYFARDQVTAFYLAQDAVEYIRNTRDNTYHAGSGWLSGFPDTNGELFTVDTTDGDMELCPVDGCPRLDYNSTNGFYSHDDASGSDSIFTRSVSIGTVNSQEVSVSVTVSWVAGTFSKSFSVKENILDWQ
ncbi:MAG: type II secretion system protein [Candidatus Paceibacterota bacterium]